MRGIWILLVFPLVAFAEKSDLQLAFQFYKQGEYGKSLRISDKYLKTNPAGRESDKLLYIYVTSETSLYRIDLRLEEYKNRNSRLFQLSVYRTMERSLVLGNYALGRKWGEVFKREAASHDFYGKGLFLYASILHAARDEKNLKELVTFSLSRNIDAYSRKRLLKLQK